MLEFCCLIGWLVDLLGSRELVAFFPDCGERGFGVGCVEISKEGNGGGGARGRGRGGESVEWT